MYICRPLPNRLVGGWYGFQWGNNLCKTKLSINGIEIESTTNPVRWGWNLGSYVFNDLTNWEKCETEKVHTQFLKSILGCDIRTSNIMARTELGRRPVICDIIRKSALYIKKKVKLNIQSLAAQALGDENLNNDNNNIFQLVRTFTLYYLIKSEPLNKKEIHNQNNVFYNEVWRTGIAKLIKS